MAEVFEGQAFLDALKSGRKDFSGCVIKNVSVEGELTGLNFSGAILDKLKFSKLAVLKGLNFHGATMEGGSFYEVSLEDVSFYGAKLDVVDFEGATLKDVCFQEAQLWVDFTKTKFQNVDFSFVEVMSIKISGGNFEGEDSAYLAKLLRLCALRENNQYEPDNETIKELRISEIHQKLLTKVKCFSFQWFNWTAFLRVLYDSQIKAG